MTSPAPFSDDDLEQLRVLAKKANEPVVAWRAQAVRAFKDRVTAQYLARLFATVEKANEERDDARESYGTACSAVDELAGENARLREALEEARDALFEAEHQLDALESRRQSVTNYVHCALNAAEDALAPRALAPKGETEREGNDG